MSAGKDIESLKQEAFDIVKTVYPAAVQDVVLKSFLNAPAANTAEYWEAILESLKQQKKEASGEVKKSSEGGFRFEIENGEAAIIEYEGKDAVANIPSSIQGSPVTAIRKDAFRLKKITAVTIPDGVKKIEESAFYGNQLTSVIIPDSVIEIGRIAFTKNQIASVTIGKNLQTIGEEAFAKNMLESITIPDSATSIGESAFMENQLNSAVIGKGVETIGKSAFRDNKLAAIDIPGSVKSIGAYAFEKNKLTSAVIGSSVTQIDDYAFSDNQLTSVTVPGSVKSIGKRAFSSNKLAKVVIENGVESIAEEAFKFNEIEEIEIADSVKSFGDGVFSDCKFNSVVIADDAVFGEKTFGHSGVVRANGTVAVEGRDDLQFQTELSPDGKSYYITGVNYVKHAGFYGRVPPILRGKPVTGIAPKAFAKYGNKGTLNIPDSVTFIGEEAFADYGGLMEVESLGKNVTSIGKKAFANASLKGGITIPDGVTQIEDDTFNKNTFLTSVTFHNNITSIGNKAFFWCKLSEVTIPGSVKSIGKEAFAKNEIASLNLGQSVKVSEDAFLQNETREGDFTVRYAGNGRSVIIVNYHGKEEELVLPSMLRGAPVSLISKGIFMSSPPSRFVFPDNANVGGDSSGMHGDVTVFKITIGNNVTFDKGKGWSLDDVAKKTVINLSMILYDTKKPEPYSEFLLPVGSIKDGEYVSFFDVYKNSGSKAGVMRLMMDIDMNVHKTGKAKWVFSDL